MKITLTGSLGHIGKPLTKQLTEEDHAVTVISRSSKREQEIESIGAKAAIGSVEDVEFLTKSFTDADAAYCMVPPNYENEPDIIKYYKRIGKNYANAIHQSGVKRVVHLSSFGAHLVEGTGPITGAHRVEEILNELSNIVLTHMRPAYFYYNLFNFIGVIKEQAVIMANYGADEFPLVAPKDIAVAVAEELQKTVNVQPIRYVASDEYTGSEIASVLGEAIGKPDLQWKIIPDEKVQKGLESTGMPKHIAGSLVDMYASIRTGKLAEDYYQHRPANMGNVKLEDFAAEFAAIYNQQ